MKKIKDLTPQEVDKICGQHECGDCPLCRGWYCLGIYPEILPKEIIPELEKKIKISQ